MIELDAGERLGPYRLLRRLGRGGMGLVFEAEHVQLGRTVALKLLVPRAAADHDFRERFVRESQLLAAMEHPNIVPIYDAGEADGLLYLAMRHVEGVDLAKEIERPEPLPPERALSVLEQVGGALDAAHARGLVHRDVKPPNVLIDSAGRVFLSDFGVAKHADARQMTKAGTILGTVDYAAPEQLKGEHVGPSADVYALGCVLFESLTGRRPFDKETEVAVIFAHALEPPPSASELRPELSEDIDGVIATALAKEPSERYGSCRELVAAARTALSLDRVVSAPRATGAQVRIQRGPAAPFAPHSKLPQAASELIGRERELAEAQDLLGREGVSLLTLTGPGGVGKTRLAIAAARGLEEAFPGGTAFVDLAPVPDPALVVSTVADALGVAEPADASERGRTRLLDAVVAGLRGPPVLLVLDNFEHVLAAAPVVGELLAEVPSLTVLITSHAALHLAEEHEYPVSPLGVPRREDTSDLEAVARAPAVALFLARARAVVPGFELDETNVAAVAAICDRLDGLPLAIELVVARLRQLSPSEILSRLESALDLTAGSEDLPARHRTLRAAIDSSYGLLDPSEQVLYRRLGIFAGGFTVAAAEEVCGTEGDSLGVVETVESLLEKSLLRRRVGGAGEARLTMLQSIHEYALYRLLEAGEADQLRRRHAGYYLTLAEEAEPELVAASQATWIRRLEAETPNLRAAFAWALDGDELELGLRAAGALTRFWSVQGQMGEGRRWLEQALDHAAEVSPAVRAKALYASGYAALGQGDFAAAAEGFEQSLALARESGDEGGVAMALAQLGWIVAARGGVVEAEVLSTESLALARRLDDGRTASAALGNLADAAAARGDYERAGALLEESLALRRAAGDDRNVANALINLGRVELARGHPDRAAALLGEGLELARGLGDTWGVSVALSSLAGVALSGEEPDGAAQLLAESLELCADRQDRRLAAECLAGLSVVAVLAGDGARSARLGGAADKLRAVTGATRSPVERSLEELGTPMPDALEPDALAAERARGAALSFEEVIEYALEGAGTS